MHARFAKVVLGLLLVALMPLEQARCACPMPGSSAPHAAATAMAPGCAKACCAARAASGARHAARPMPLDACPCLHQATPAPQLALVVPAAAAPAPFAALAAGPLPVPAPVPAGEITPALDIGGPPAPPDLSAHGLRAPPVSA